MVSTWVWPRVNMPEPWTRGSSETSAASGPLMDAGVPIKEPVAGISCGLITEGDRWMTMVDIQGLEDFFGDMDFKDGKL